jgi:predicted nucleic acid-binding protein
MRIVLDTNAVVSGLLQARGNPAKVLACLRFKVEPKRVREVLNKIETDGLAVDAGEESNFDLPDPADEPFLAVALAVPADFFVRGNLADYPNEAEERKILDRMAFTSPEQPVKPVVSLEEILATRKLVDQIHVDDKIRDYIVKIVFATRQPADFKLDLKHFIQFGASPRATIYLTVAAKAWALLQGRDYVVPEDVKSIGPDVLRHRIIVTYEAEAQAVTTDAIIKKVFNAVPVP